MFLKGAPPAFTLDFLPQRARPSIVGWVLLLAGVISVCAVLLEHVDLQERVDDLQAQNARAERAILRTAGLAQKRKQERVPDSELHSAARLASSLQSPWTELLPQLEAATANGKGSKGGKDKANEQEISLLSLDADNAKAQISVSGEARSLEAVFAYAQRLGAQSGFSSVQVLSYEFHRSGVIEAVQFKLAARWQPLT